MAFLAVSGFQQIGTYTAGFSYGSWPWPARDAALNKHLVFRDWDTTNIAGHSTGGAGWYSRNDGAPTKLWDTASEGNQIQDTWVLPLASGNLAFILRLFNSTGPDYRHRYAISTDAGVTIPAMATMPIPSGVSWTTATQWAFGDFLRSSNGAKWYGAAYDASSNIELLETADGLTWAKRGRIAAALGNESGLFRMADGRIVCAFRPATNSNPGYTCYSDDDGATWTSPIQPNANATSVFGNNFCIVSPPRGRVVGNNIVIAGRWLSGSGDVWNAQWVIDRNGAYVSGPVKITGTNSAAGGYWAFLDDREAYGYGDLGTNGGDSMVHKVNIKLSG